MNKTLVVCMLVGLLGVAEICVAGNPVDPAASDRGQDLLSCVEGDEMLTLACGFSVPRILDAAGFPPHGPALSRSHPYEDDRANVLDLWRADQHVAAWRTPGTNVVTLLKLAYRFPSDILDPRQMRRPNAYLRDAQSIASDAASAIGAGHVETWLHDYYLAGAPATVSFQSIPVNVSLDAVAACTGYEVKGCDPPRHVYVFTLRELPGSACPGGAWYALEVRSPQVASLPFPSFAESFLRRLTVNASELAAEQAYWAQERFDSFAYANAVRGVRNLGGEWECFRGGSFCLITDNLEAAGLAEQGLEAQQRAYDLFPTVLFPFGPAALDDVCVIRVYATGWEFEDGVPPTRRWAGGLYMPDRDEIAMRGWSREGTVHEIAHRYLRLACGKQAISAWFNEGFACYFSKCRVSGGRLVAKPVNVRHLLFDMIENGELRTVESVFTVPDFYLDKEAGLDLKDPQAACQRAKNYAAAWGVIYFLREGPAFFPGMGYEMLIPLYWETLRRTGNPRKATDAVLAKIIMPSFLADFSTFFLNYAERVAARGIRRRGDQPVYDLEHEEYMPRDYRPVFSDPSLHGQTTTGTDEAAFDAAGNGRVGSGATVADDDTSNEDSTWQAGESTRAGVRKAKPLDTQRSKRRERRHAPSLVGLVLLAVLVGAWRLHKHGKVLLFMLLISAGGLSGEVVEANGYLFVYRLVDNGVELGDGTGCAIFPKPAGDFKVPPLLANLPVVAIGPYAFSECEEMTRAFLPETVTSIGECAFYGCTSLRSVPLPASVTHIGAGAFFLCSSLQGVRLPPQITAIAEWTFARCFRLSSVTFSNAVGSIGSSAFLGCAALKSVTVPVSVTNIGNRAFMWCSGLRSVRIAGPVAMIDSEVFAGCSDLGAIELPGTVTTLGQGAFQGCSSLQSLAIPDAMTRIGNSAFRGCYRLVSIDLPNTVAHIGDHAFCDCLSLQRIGLGNGLTEIGAQAFGACHALSSIDLPVSLVVIREAAFSRCSSLNSVVLPAGLTVLGESAFERCTQLSSVFFAGNVPPSRRQIFARTPDALTIRYAPSASGWGETFGGRPARAGTEAVE